MKKTYLLLSLASIFFLASCQAQNASPIPDSDVLLTDQEGISAKLINKAVNADGYEYLSYSYTITPDYLVDDIVGALSWSQSGVSDDVSTFLTVSVNNNMHRFTVTKLKDFSNQAKLTLYSYSRPSVNGTVLIDLARKWSGTDNRIYVFDWVDKETIDHEAISSNYENDVNNFSIGKLNSWIEESFLSKTYTVDSFSFSNESFNSENKDGNLWNPLVTKKVETVTTLTSTSYQSQVLCYWLTGANWTFIRNNGRMITDDQDRQTYYLSSTDDFNSLIPSSQQFYYPYYSSNTSYSQAKNFDEYNQVYNTIGQVDVSFTGFSYSVNTWNWLNTAGASSNSNSTSSTAYVGLPLNFEYRVSTGSVNKVVRVIYTMFVSFDPTSLSNAFTLSVSNITF